MKHYYLKEKVFALRDRYKVFDEKEELAYYCEGKMFSFTRTMEFFKTPEKNLLYTIKRQVFSFLPVYRLFKPDGHEAALIKKKFTLLRQEFAITSEYGDLTMEGNTWGYDFTVKLGGTLLLEVHKKWLSWGDTYEITIHDETRTDMLIALVLMIDDCLHDAQNQHH